MKDVLYLKFENLPTPVAFINCRDLIDYFPVIFSGWRIDEVHESNPSPAITLTRNDSKYQLEADWLDEPQCYSDRVDAICGLVAKLAVARVMHDRKLLCLHAAAVEMDGKLVIFPSKYRAGKSILSVALAAAKVKFFCDDVLPVSPTEGYGIATGLAPRLRLPLPDNLNAQTREFIQSRSALAGERYFYLDFRDGIQANRDSCVPVGAFVLLEREEGVEAVLESISDAEVLRQVVWQNFAREVESPLILNSLGQIVAGAQRYRLRYDTAEDAVKLLEKTFSKWPETDKQYTPISITTQSGVNKIIEVPKGCLLRKEGISEVTADGELFLADSTGAAIHHLNPIGSMIWAVFAEPISTQQVIELLQTAFPDTDQDQIQRDVNSLIKALLSKKLLISGPVKIESGQ